MNSLFCPMCRLRQPIDHLYCVSCGASLPSHLVSEEPSKVARFFAGIKIGDDDPETGYLRVSCYRKESRIESDEGSVRMPGNHVRVSMWVDNAARCVMSLPESEAREMATFVLDQVGSEGVGRATLGA
ncbi:MAG TPA: hypothetical protein VJ927_10690 [Actinomycetota bacterium]|nr:hypothetical protein [Actinomycetota bacterium]